MGGCGGMCQSNLLCICHAPIYHVYALYTYTCSCSFMAECVTSISLVLQYGYSELSDISYYIIVWKWCLLSCFLLKNGGRWPSLAAIFPQKAAPHTSLPHYNAKYQITQNSRIDCSRNAKKILFAIYHEFS